MRVALIGDVHANLPSLQAVLVHARTRGIETIWSVGDLIGQGASPNEVLELLDRANVLGIAGNYDLAVLGVEQNTDASRKTGSEEQATLRRVYDSLLPESREYLGSLPREIRLEVEGKRVLLTHGSPASDTEPLSPDTPQERLRELANMADADVIICGHSHQPFKRKVKGVWFINTGSVGRPAGSDDRACYATLSIGPGRVQACHHQVEYEHERDVGSGAERRSKGRARRTQQPSNVAAAPQSSEETTAQAPAPEVEEAKDSRFQAVLQLARSCEYEVGHTHQVTRLALQLFDELRTVHGLGPKERFWLHCAGLLHDIGLIEGVQGHHKASLRIILDTPLLPFGKSERNVIASIARYHRGALPDERHAHFARLRPALRRRVRILATVLRVADGLDYTHQSLVQDLSCDVSSQQVLIRCTVRQPAELERERALDKGQLLEQVFERKLVIDLRRVE